MYDYMKALQERFDKKPPERLVRAVQSAREEVRDGMDDEKRKKLLRLLDAQNILLEEATLLSFTAGFKLAWGIAEELGAPPTTPMRNKRRRMHTQRTKNAPSAGWFSPQCVFTPLLTI